MIIMFIDLLCILFPGIVFCFLREKIFNINYNYPSDAIIKRIFSIIEGIVINYALFSIVYYYLLNKQELIFNRIESSNIFLTKYLIFGLLSAVLLTFFEKILMDKLINKFKINLKLDLSILDFSEVNKNILLILYILFLLSLHLIRCFDNSFWGDEGIVIVNSRKNFYDLITTVASDNHSPLHYIFAWMLVKVFGESGFILHLSSTIAYFFIMAIAYSIIKNWFGYKTAFIFVTLCSLLDNAVTYNLEVRMYTWAQLFILLSFLTSYGIICYKKRFHYFLLLLCSLGAVYSHYFALMSICSVYLFLLLYDLNNDKKEVKKVVYSGILFILLFLPWIIFTQKLRGTFVANYGIGHVGFKDCILFIFQSKMSMILLLLFICSLLISFCLDFGYIRIINKSRDVSQELNTDNFTFSLELKKLWYWMIGGIIGALGTIVSAQIISHLFYPIICLRYLYISYITLWLVFCICISKIDHYKILSIIVIMSIIVSCVPNCFDKIIQERSNNKLLVKTLELTKSEIKGSDFIYTDIVHFAWTICKSYYPGVPHDLFGHPEWGNWGLPIRLVNLDSNKNYWLFLSSPISSEIVKDLDEQKFKAKLVVDKGFIGTGEVWVYKVVNN